MAIPPFPMTTLFIGAAACFALLQTALPPRESFESFSRRISAIPDSASRGREVDRYIQGVRESANITAEDSSAVLLFRGNARHVFAAGDPNGWDPRADELKRLPGTDLFFLRWPLDQAARVEYKLVVDSSWILDPLNPLKAPGGYGVNSELRMPAYHPPAEAVVRSGIPRGTLDTIAFTSDGLSRRLNVLVYLPAHYEGGAGRYPVIFVTDGGEYLSIAGMDVILDNLIASGEIAPLIAVFIDPRKNPADPASSTRMTDYALSDTFVGALAGELRPWLVRKYRILDGPANTAIMGASMGGLIATYAAFTRPEVFGFCAAQSPSYQWGNDTLMTMLGKGTRKEFRMYLSTGTILDAQRRARIVRGIMQEKGYPVTYAEYPESHNWMNWRGRIGDILRTFRGMR